jgi:hypothetical protein
MTPDINRAPEPAPIIDGSHQPQLRTTPPSGATLGNNVRVALEVG